MATNKKTTKKNKVLSYRISHVIFSLTFLGTMWRTALFVALLLAITVMHAASLVWMTGGRYPLGTMHEALWPIIAFASAFVLYDTLYVYVAQRYREIDLVDKMILFGLEFVVAFSLLLQAGFHTFVAIKPNIMNEGYSFLFWLLVIAVLLLPLRAFIGVSYVVMTRKTK